MKIKHILNFLIILIWVGIFFATQATGAPNLGLHNFYSPIINFYNTNSINNFPGFEVICFLFVTFIFIYYYNQFTIPNKNILIFYIASCIFTGLSILNPNNYIQEGILRFFMMRITRTIIFIPIIGFVLYFLNFKIFISIVKKFFRIGLIIAIVKASIDLLTFITNTGYHNYYNKNVATLGGDVLSWVAIFHVLTFSIYLLTNKAKYRNFSIVFFLCLFFSYQRTSLLTIIIFDVIFYLVLIVIKKKFSFLLKAIINISIFIVLFFVFITKTNIGKDLFYRYSSVLMFTRSGDIYEYDEPQYSDSGHITQSIQTTQFLVKNYNNFWGGGINRRNEEYLEVRGQSAGGVHNNIVSMWQYFGMPGVFYLFFLFFLFIYNFITLLSLKIKNEFFNGLYLAISIYFIIRIIIGWFSGDFFFMYYQILLQYILLMMISKLSFYERYNPKFKEIMNYILKI